jgi:VIT1/CCC1 family predicted Fe2+/Mn2+ transporter
MIKNINSQTMPIRVSSISNFLLGGLVAGCLVIGIAHLVESGKRTAIEEQFFTEVKELPAHEVEEIIKNAILKRISESKKVENELLSDQKEAMNSAESYGGNKNIQENFPEVEELVAYLNNMAKKINDAQN